ncbi:MAG TPA: flagellar hook-basal body protein [Pirellulaceae bacterium]|nr:flagellar hook-basal body protein [Pirellulaceae bacterium]
MPYGLYISAAGAHAQSQRVEVLSNNIANAQTPGFKRELAVLQARYAEAITEGEDYPGTRGVNNVGGGVFLKQTVTDFTAGPLKATGGRSDLAIEGEGFFLVEKNNQKLLTRAGNFSVSSDGRLMGPGNSQVLTEDGNPVLIDPSTDWSFDSSGNLLQDGNSTSLAIVKPRSLGDLAKAGENLFLPLAPTTPIDPLTRKVVPGHVEMSASNPILEMTQLIESSRAYEANIRMIQNHDQVLGALVGRLIKAT